MQFTTTSWKAYSLEANATGMNTAKNQFYLIQKKKKRGAPNTIKTLIVDNKKTTEQPHSSECIKVKVKVFSVISIFQNSLKIKQNFERKI